MDAKTLALIDRILSKQLRYMAAAVFLGFGLGACAGDQEAEEPVEVVDQETASDEATAAGESAPDEGAGFVETDESNFDSGEQMASEDTQTASEDGTDTPVPDFLSDEETSGAGMSNAALASEEPVGGEMSGAEDSEPVEEASWTMASAASDSAEVADAGISESFGEESEAEVETPAPAKINTVATEKPKPAIAASSSSWESTGETGRYVVQPGDSLSKISLKVYGTIERWQELAARNGISDPSRIFPGDELTFELTNAAAKEFAARYESLPKQKHVVRPGETLNSIAKDLYGKNGSWKQLVSWNRDRIGNPNRIPAGMTIYYVAPKDLIQSAAVGGKPANSHEDEAALATHGH